MTTATNQKEKKQQRQQLEQQVFTNLGIKGKMVSIIIINEPIYYNLENQRQKLCLGNYANGQEWTKTQKQQQQYKLINEDLAVVTKFIENQIILMEKSPFEQKLDGLRLKGRNSLMIVFQLTTALYVANGDRQKVGNKLHGQISLTKYQMQRQLQTRYSHRISNKAVQGQMYFFN